MRRVRSRATSSLKVARRGVALIPKGDWGTRVLSAFEQELTAGGGLLMSSVTFDTVLTDYAPEITQVLSISDSHARHRRLESILGTKLQFEPRRRGDIEFIFAASQAGTMRLLRPQLKFHFAGDIPTYATSDAYEPDPMANEDMQGLMFPDMPWMLGGEPADSVRAAAREAWPTGGPRRNRLFAFGYDAYRICDQPARRQAEDADARWAHGQTSLDSAGRVQRELAWAQMQNGQAKPLTPVSRPRRRPLTRHPIHARRRDPAPIGLQRLGILTRAGSSRHEPQNRNHDSLSDAPARGRLVASHRRSG